MYKSKNVLVAGGTGTIGISLVKQLINKGANVKVASLDTLDYAKKVLGTEVEFCHANFLNIDDCKKVMYKQEFVFNLVGIKGSVGLGETKVSTYLNNMLRFETNLVEAAFLAEVKKFLFVSSICIYPQADIHFEDNAWNGLPKQNDKIPGLAKRMGEILGEAYFKQYGWDAMRIIRPSNVYGPFDDFNPETAQVIPALIARVNSGENPLVVWGDGNAIRDFIFVDEVAKWMIIALERLPACLPVNIGSGCGYTIKEIVKYIFEASDKEINVAWDVTKPTGDTKRVLSIERAKKLLNFKEEVTIQQGIKNTVEWFLNNKNLAKEKLAGANYE